MHRLAMDSSDDSDEFFDDSPRKPDEPSSKNQVADFKFGLAIVTLFVVIGLGGCWLDGFDPVLSVYVATQVVTTVGYGDFCPRRQVTRLIWALFVLLVIIALAYALNLVMTRVLELQEKAVHKVITRGETILQSVRVIEHPHDQHWMQLASATMTFLGFVAFGTIYFAVFENCSCSYGRTAVADCDESSYQSCVQTGGYVKTWIDSFYLSVITLTTVGFGDVTPVTYCGRAVGSVWMLVGVAATANWISAFSNSIFAHTANKKAQRRQPDVDLFNMLDSDGDGHLTRSEHHLYIILKHRLVSPHFITKLDEKFHAVGRSKDGVLSFQHIDGGHFPISPYSLKN